MTSIRAARPAGQMLAVPAGSIGANALAYLLLIAAAHALYPGAYGELVTLLGVLVVGTVPALALQTMVARRVATKSHLHSVPIATVILAVGSGLFLVALSLPLARFLHLSSMAGLLWIAVALPPTTMFGAALGAAQGAQRFGRLAGLTVLQGVGRSCGGLAGLLTGRSAAATAAGVAVGTALALLPTIAARRHTRHGLRVRGLGDILAETANAAHAYGAFLVLINVDVLLARHVLAPAEAGLYAAGSVITRVALWLPQSIVLLVFAQLTRRANHYRMVRRSGAVIVGIGAAVVIGIAMAGDAVAAVLGGNYDRLAAIGWVYALLGACLAVLQFAVLAGLAVLRARRIVVLWLAIAADTTAVLTLGDGASPLRVAVTVTAVAGVCAGVTFMLAARDIDTPTANGQFELVSGQAAGKYEGSTPAPNLPATP